MLEDNYYYTIEQTEEFEVKIKRSIFIAHLKKILTIAEAKEYISSISAKHKTANHNCWAYIVGNKGETFHSSDAGEPSGTAGLPMLNALKRHRMSSIVVVVTRYFGGVKLGIKGLIEAYSGVVEAAVERSSKQKIVELVNYRVITSYNFLETLKYNLKAYEVEISNFDYTEKVRFDIIVEVSKNENLIKYLSELSAQGKLSFEKI
ncbi:MAG: YigZ family protein [Candidatus Cloacimonetes bacterium]|nr:YigZ family protein [Candidatus Cloacimonadota bacterium]